MDSWFTTFKCVDELMTAGLYCIGNMKTGNARTPVALIKAALLPGRDHRGDSVTVKTTSKAGNIMYGTAWGDNHQKMYCWTGGYDTVDGYAVKRRCACCPPRVKPQCTHVLMSQRLFR